MDSKKTLLKTLYRFSEKVLIDILIESNKDLSAQKTSNENVELTERDKKLIDVLNGISITDRQKNAILKIIEIVTGKPINHNFIKEENTLKLDNIALIKFNVEGNEGDFNIKVPVLIVNDDFGFGPKNSDEYGISFYDYLKSNEVTVLSEEEIRKEFPKIYKYMKLSIDNDGDDVGSDE